MVLKWVFMVCMLSMLLLLFAVVVVVIGVQSVFGIIICASTCQRSSSKLRI